MWYVCIRTNERLRALKAGQRTHEHGCSEFKCSRDVGRKRKREGEREVECELASAVRKRVIEMSDGGKKKSLAAWKLMFARPWYEGVCIVGSRARYRPFGARCLGNECQLCK